MLWARLESWDRLFELGPTSCITKPLHVKEDRRENVVRSVCFFLFVCFGLFSFTLEDDQLP